MLSSTDIKTEALQQQQQSSSNMEEDEGGVDPLEMPPASSALMGPVQEVPEDLSLKKEVSSSANSSSSPHHQQGFIKTNVSRSSSSPSSEGQIIYQSHQVVKQRQYFQCTGTGTTVVYCGHPVPE
jgi:hypothetical protein